jgi:hypothetical protein
MIEPITAVAWAFSTVKAITQSEQGKKFIEGIIEKSAEKLTDAGIQKTKHLRDVIVAKLQGNPSAQEALAKAEASGAENDFKVVANYLAQDQAFVRHLQGLVQEIQTLVQIDDVNAENVQQISGGQGLQVNHPTAPTIQAKDSPVTINYHDH